MTVQHVKEWKTQKCKSQAEINEEIDRLFGAKKIREYEEDGKVISVYDAR